MHIDVDFSKEIGNIRALHGVNLGPKDGAADMTDHHRALGIPYNRLHDCPYAVPDTVDIHCVFPDFDADPADPASYRFGPTDDYLQDVLATEAKIIYRLGESIEHQPEKKHVHPPTDNSKWAEICIGIIRHYNEAWANGFELGIEYWEIWNEPWHPCCWTGTMAQYNALYEVAAKRVKQHDPSLKVGGMSGESRITDAPKQFLEHVRRTDTPLDFFSWHKYGWNPAEMVTVAREYRELVNEYGFSQAEMHLNEWNYHPSDWSWMERREKPTELRARICGCEGAAFDAATLVLLQDEPVDLANFYTARGGMFGLFDKQGKPQKNYYGVKAFADMLQTPQRVWTSDSDRNGAAAVLAGRSGDRAAVLLTNFNDSPHTVQITLGNLPGTEACKVMRQCVSADEDYKISRIGSVNPDAPKLTQELPAWSVTRLSFE